MLYNIGFYPRANFQLEISYIYDPVKMTKSDVYSSKQCKFLKL
jgi:hypothetical protein